MEVHAANGYLIDQFLQDSANQRTDRYGGSIENRARLLLETVDSLIETVGADRIGVHISPASTFQDVADSDPQAQFCYILDALASRDLVYLHLVEAGIVGVDTSTEPRSGGSIVGAWVRKRYPGNVIATGDCDRERALRPVESGGVDAVGFGRGFLVNPALPTRLASNTSLSAAQRSTSFGGDQHSYGRHISGDP